MELWDQEAVELVGPGYFEFGPNNAGSFGFVAVEGWMDIRQRVREGRPGVEFSWEGWDDGEQTSGRGWAALTSEGSLEGRIFIHRGDDCAFRAVPDPFPPEG